MPPRARPCDDVDRLDLGGGDELRAALERLGHVAHVGGALGPGGTAEAYADAPACRSRALKGKTPWRRPRWSVPLAMIGPIAPTWSGLAGGDLEHLLDALVVRREAVARELAAEAEALAPHRQTSALACGSRCRSSRLRGAGRRRARSRPGCRRCRARPSGPGRRGRATCRSGEGRPVKLDRLW